ncbi:MAG: hypothetical protein Q7T87_07400 [Polaromonas sp.]|nr:hypothetical protein [Polaromonas sp.]
MNDINSSNGNDIDDTSDHDEARPLAGSADDIRDLAQGVFDRVMAAHEEVDYSQLAPLLSPAMAEALDEATFETIIADHLATLGDLEGTDYLGSLHKGNATQLLWRARYSGSEAEVLWQLFLARVGDKVEIGGLLFS